MGGVFAIRSLALASEKEVSKQRKDDQVGTGAAPRYNTPLKFEVKMANALTIVRYRRHRKKVMREGGIDFAGNSQLHS